MTLVRTEAVPHPMVYVEMTSSVDPKVMSAAIRTAIEKLQSFFGQTAIIPIGVPLTVYKGGSTDYVTMDIGFPVDALALQRASGEVLAGQTPAGPAVKVKHKGSYSSLHETYRQAESDMRAKGWKPGELRWEVYHKGPGMVEEAEFETDVFIQLAVDHPLKSGTVK